MTKSKFKIRFVLWFIFMNVCTVGLVWIIWRIIEKIMIKGIEISSILMLILFVFIFMFTLIVLKDFKYIIVNKTNKTVKWFSIYHIFGKTIELNNYIGLIKTTEYGIAGEYKTIHLVDSSSITSVKINGLFYKNFDKIYSSIELKEIRKYHFGIWKYVKLNFTGKIKIE